MNVRRAKIEDAPAVALVMAAVAEEGLIGTEPPVDLDERAKRFRESIDSEEPGATWVLEDEKEIVGYAAVWSRVVGVLVLGMALLPEARGRGAGRALLDAAIRHGRGQGAHKLELEAWVDNGHAVALYTSAGFEVEGVRREHYRRRDGSLRSSIIMARRLDR